MDLSLPQSLFLNLTKKLSDQGSEVQKNNILQDSIQATVENSSQPTYGYNGIGQSLAGGVTYADLMDPKSNSQLQYCLTNDAGEILVDKETADAYREAKGSWEDFAAKMAEKDSNVNSATRFVTNYDDQKIFDYLKSIGGWSMSTWGRNFTNLKGETIHFTANQNSQDPYETMTLFYPIEDPVGSPQNVLESLWGRVDSVICCIGNALNQQGIDIGDFAGEYDNAIVSTRIFYQSQLEASASTEETLDNFGCGTTKIYKANEDGSEKYYVDVNQIVKTFLNYFDAHCAKSDNDPNTSPDDFTANITDIVSNRKDHGGTGEKNIVPAKAKTPVKTPPAPASTVTVPENKQIPDVQEPVEKASSPQDSEPKVVSEEKVIDTKNYNQYYKRLFARMGAGKEKNYFTINGSAQETINNAAWLKMQIENKQLQLEKIIERIKEFAFDDAQNKTSSEGKTKADYEDEMQLLQQSINIYNAISSKFFNA